MRFNRVTTSALLSTLYHALPSSSAPSPQGWTFIQEGESGIVALEAIVVSPTLVVTFDRAQHNPLMIDGHNAWAALWNLETNTATALNATTDTFCASGSILSNGTMASVGGMHPENTQDEPDQDGRMSIRLFGPCDDVNGVGCELFDNPELLHMNTTRWYTSTVRIFDGSIMIVGGTADETPFFNVQPENSFEFFPKKDGGAVRQSDFLARTVPVNLFPRAFALPDGKVFMLANNQTQIYDIETDTETPLPDLPNGVRVSNPFDGTAQMLPLSPPLYTPEILVCGGSNSTETVNSTNLSSQDPASDQCSRITLTPEGIAKGWEVEHLPQGRMMPEMILMPNGQVLIINGAETGYAAINSVSDAVNGTSNADHPIFQPLLYTPSNALGKRISAEGLPQTDIARVYHSSVTLTPNGNILLSGSNPNNDVNNGTEFFNTEFRVETLNPPFMFVDRPTMAGVPKQILFNKQFKATVNIPKGLDTKKIQVSLMDLGFSSHAFHSSARLVFLDFTLSKDGKTLTMTAPPNNRVYPPGPAFLFLTVDDVTSTGAHVMVGDMSNPPVQEQGIALPSQ